MMQRFFILYFLLPIVTFFLMGCQPKLTYSYLMTHPAALEKQVMYCQRITDPDNTDCRTALRAMTDFMTLAREQQFDPERFGKKIMQAEEACVETRENMLQARQHYETVQNKQNIADVDKLKEYYHVAQRAYQIQREQVHILLAVVSLSSPE